MRYQIQSSEFEGVQCDLDGLLPKASIKRDPAHLFAFILLSACLAALLVTGIYGLATQSFAPVGVTWTVCLPPLTLLIRKYVGPFNGWL